MNSQQAVELLKQMIAIPSHSRDEKGVADMLQNYVEQLGYKVNRCVHNLWIQSSFWSNEKPTLLLDGHIDTVKPADGWQTDPYTPVEQDGKLIGLGSNDTGGSVVSLLATFLELDKKEQPYNIIWLASTEEEVTGENGIRAVLQALPKIDVAIVGEPTGMQPATAERGLLVLDCVATGKAGHAAREEGVNAIYEALPDIEWFKNYKFPKVSDELGGVKMTVTGVNAGTLHNVIPAECSFMVDIRINDCYTNVEIYEMVCKSVKCSVKARSFKHNSSSIAKSHPIVQKCIEMGLTPFGSPTTSNQTAMNFPTLKMGPGQSSRSHTANEFIYISEIEQAIEMYVKLLDGLKI